MLDLAARLAVRAAGDVAPNPMVGAVLVKNGRVIGMGHHRRFGGLHAELEAIADCRRRGGDPRGATVYVTLEPCCHHGKQPPCTDALIEAGVVRVVAARPDPNPVSCGGAEVLRRAGIGCEFDGSSPLAMFASEAFVKRVETGLPWVIAKWAQTPDGRLLTRSDEPRWISGELSRRRVHRLRSRVDAIVTGIGTVLADDPLMNVRGVRRHRTALRVVLDPLGELPASSNLAKTLADGPVQVYSSKLAQSGGVPGVRTTVVPGDAQALDLTWILADLARTHGVSNVMLEAGPRLLGGFLAAGLVDAALVHVGRSAGMSMPAASDLNPAVSGWDAGQFEVCRQRSRGGDLELWLRRISATRA